MNWFILLFSEEGKGTYSTVLAGKSQGQMSLAGYLFMGSQRGEHD